jgi:hypothetical protein
MMPPSLELVSLHIPKTAGTSLRGILLDHFGAGLAKLDLYDSGSLKFNDQAWDGRQWPKHTRAVHGHFKFDSIGPLLPGPAETAWITWVRHPVERVVSNYYFLHQVIAQRIAELPDENLWSRMGKTIEEFVAHEANCNVMSAFLHSAPLEQFAFVGIQDDFEQEIQLMALALGWPQPKTKHFNTTSNKPTSINADLRSWIEQHNALDLELYERALQLRMGRLNQKHP